MLNEPGRCFAYTLGMLLLTKSRPAFQSARFRVLGVPHEQRPALTLFPTNALPRRSPSSFLFTPTAPPPPAESAAPARASADPSVFETRCTARVSSSLPLACPDPAASRRTRRRA